MNTLKKYEIDIFLPDLNLGFECNGLWWHSENYKEKNYHLNKKEFFLENGINLIQIWEDDWNYKNNIVKSRILNLISHQYKKIIYARNCEIKEINVLDTKEFLNKNHLQGYAISKYNIGLYHGECLVSLISFSKLRKNLGNENQDGHFEILRFCSANDYNIIGAASKLIEYFKKKYKPRKIISYASRDWSEGNLYEKLGFTKIKYTTPNYFYFHKDEGLRLNRFNFRKDKLVSEGFDKNLSEHKIMNMRNYYRIYDTGSILFEMNFDDES